MDPDRLGRRELDFKGGCRIPASLRTEHVGLLIEREVQAGGCGVDRRDPRGLRDAAGRDAVEEPPEGKRLRELLLRVASSAAPHVANGTRGNVRMSLRYSDWKDLSARRRCRSASDVAWYPHEQEHEHYGREDAPAASDGIGGHPRAGSARATNR